MAQVNNKHRLEEERLAAFEQERKHKRLELLKRVLIIVVCIGLVLAFTLPSMGRLLK